MVAASKQHQIIVKVKCFRELKRYAFKKKERLEKLSSAQKALRHLLKSKIFNHLINFAAKNAIKRSLNLRAT